MDVLGGILSIVSGGATGLIGSVASGIFAYKSKKLDIDLQRDKFNNEIALKKVDAEIMAQEWAARTKVADIEATAKVEAEDAKAFSAALTSEPQRYSVGNLSAKQNWLMVLLDFLRGIIRPGLTLYLCAITTVIYIKASKLMSVDFVLPGMAYDLLTQIVNTILYLTTTCVLFWFGTRNKEKQK